ncbi:glycosyltransferase family 2 protein [uncultured Nostoc sp.]|uniref:glycosyltransferase family 2 protein n=1 Tax=uncultured Nostoc sp. TaxID=340711 RepID=UPI00263878CC|nr:glycosyltransferase family 2 protein [uncultured Nostoc sp.]
MISAVLVTYNRAERLKLAIQDILNQSFANFELIICDDCSPDHTKEICEEFAAKDNRIHYVKRDRNLRMPHNLNEGIRIAKYEYVAILHDADRYEPELFALWYEALDKYPNVAFAFYQHTTINDTEKIVRICKESFEGVVSGKYLLRQIFFRRWGFDSPVFGIAIGRKSLFEKLGMFNSIYGFYADVDMWMSLLHDWDAFYVAKPVVRSYIETRQFDDNTWKISSMIKEMHLKHREIEFFQSGWLRLTIERLIYYVYSYIVNIYYLLLNYKHKDLNNLVLARNFLKKDTFFLLPFWLILIVLYPFRGILNFPSYIPSKNN